MGVGHCREGEEDTDLVKSINPTVRVGNYNIAVWKHEIHGSGVVGFMIDWLYVWNHDN